MSILEKMPNFNDRITLAKKDINLKDLSALTAYTGDEFALFTRKNERLVVRGNATECRISIKEAKKMSKEGYRWSGHTHPGTDSFSLTASEGDVNILNCFNQQFSCIYNSAGMYNVFEREN